MERFINKHQDKITGTLSCFDRLLFKGYLPISFPQAMESFMNRHELLLKDFKQFVKKHSETLKVHALTTAQCSARPYIYLKAPIRKDDRARQIAKQDNITNGLICVFSILEQCQSFKLAYGKDKPRIVSSNPRCLCLYFYFVDREFGFMHVRIQTWFPFVVQIYINGHEWLARKMDKHGLAYQQADNAFLSIEDPERAQRFADSMARKNWPLVLEAFAKRVNPLLNNLLAGMAYYWVADQAEYATDIMFKDRASLKDLYDTMLRHATLCFSAEDVLTFLGRKLHGNFSGEIMNTLKKRWPGTRIKHRMKGNWIKMYDKFGCVLRIETVINHPYEFKIRRMGKRNGELVIGWYPMAKRVSNLYRYAEVCISANKRYLEALCAVENPTEAYSMLDRVCEPVTRNGRRHRGINPLRKDDVSLFAAVLKGEHFIRGFRNRDLAKQLKLKQSRNPLERRRQSARVTRLLQLLRAHGLIAKIPRSRRYRLTVRGAILMSAAVHLRTEEMPARILKPAA